MTVNEKILEYLRMKGKSQTELAQKLGVAQPNLYRMLNADDLKVSVLIKIADFLEVSPTYFFDGVTGVSNEEVQKLKEENALLKQNITLKNREAYDKYYYTAKEILKYQLPQYSEELRNKVLQKLEERTETINYFNIIIDEAMSEFVKLQLIDEKVKDSLIEELEEDKRKEKSTPRAKNIKRIKSEREMKEREEKIKKEVEGEMKKLTSKK